MKYYCGFQTLSTIVVAVNILRQKTELPSFSKDAAASTTTSALSIDHRSMENPYIDIGIVGAEIRLCTQMRFVLLQVSNILGSGVLLTTTSEDATGKFEEFCTGSEGKACGAEVGKRFLESSQSNLNNHWICSGRKVTHPEKGYLWHCAD